MNNDPQKQYFNEFDGLRAIAVAAVVIYHCRFNVRGDVFWLSGGFIGVDVFFVLSGFLITRLLLLEQIETGTINLIGFYARRARRLLPALLLMILVVNAMGIQFLVASRLTELGKSSVASSLFSSNFFFYFSTTVYGAEHSPLRPLLHTWSLAVEEQFYFIFPLLLISLKAVSKRGLTGILLSLLFISLIISGLSAPRYLEANFYFPFSRFWELLSGVLVGIAFATQDADQNKQRLNPWLADLGTISGLGAILCSFFVFDSKTAHPGFATLIPVVGTVAIIWFAPSSRTGPYILSAPPLVWIGKLFYSIYLWHFPVLAFGRIAYPELTDTHKIVLVGLALALAVMSYYTVEMPVRYGRSFGKHFKSILSFQMVAICAFAGFFILSNGMPKRFEYSGNLTNYELDNQKLFQDRKKTPQPQKWSKSSKTKVLIVGNSHSLDTLNAFYMNEELFHLL